jgi:hypothetical protein
MALYRLICALGQQNLVPVLTRCGLPLPVYFLADEKHSRCLTEKVSLPTIVCGRVIWHLGYTTHASTAAFTQSYQEFQRAAVQQEPTYRVRRILTDGFDSTTSSMRTLFPGARLGNCLRHAINKLPAKLVALASSERMALRSQFHILLYRARQRKGLRVFALAQPVQGVGIAIPVFLPPIVAAGTALLLSRRLAPPLAYISGSLGALIGADLLNLGQMHGLAAPIASIGGAGMFDGVFLTGLLAVLLA